MPFTAFGASRSTGGDPRAAFGPLFAFDNRHDLGNAGHPLLVTPPPPPRADGVVIETTYGDRLHKPMDASIDELYGAISDTLGRGGNVIIPTFALERAQEAPLDAQSGDRKKPIDAVDTGLS